jgi:spermidine synthase
MIRFCEKDPCSPVQYSYEVSRILYNGKSKFQDIAVIENPFFAGFSPERLAGKTR